MLNHYIIASFFNIKMKILDKKYRDLISLAMLVNGRKETLDLLYEAAKLNKNLNNI